LQKITELHVSAELKEMLITPIYKPQHTVNWLHRPTHMRFDQCNKVQVIVTMTSKLNVA